MTPDSPLRPESDEPAARAPAAGAALRAPAAPGRAAEANAGATPMMAQYQRIKGEHPDCLLFYRMGDFYELFFDDARKAAGALDIALTHRGKHLGEDVPMCGVPVHSADAYLARLIRKGFKVAVCEQMEDPAEARKRGAKAVVAREVIRLITPGTLTEDTLLEADRNNFLAALAEAEGGLGLAWLDISTGAFFTQALGAATLPAALARIRPGEVLASERLIQGGAAGRALAAACEELGAALTGQAPALFDSGNARRRLEKLFAVAALDAFGRFSRAELAAAGALVSYVELTQKGSLPRIAQPQRIEEGAALEIDAQTRRNLELTESMAGGRRGSLLDCIDGTRTGAGGRLLASLLAAPLTGASAINDRLDAVAWFEAASPAFDPAAVTREALSGLPDIERALARLTVGRGGPRDLGAVRDGLKQAGELAEALAARGSQALAPPPSLVAEWTRGLGDHEELIAHLARALAPDPPLLARDGGLVAKGFDPALEETRALRDESRQLIAGLEARYREATGLANLKVRHNNVLGYFLEVRPNQADALMNLEGPNGEARFYHHRQTLASAVRFNTGELVELESKIARAADRALAQELEIFDRLVAAVCGRADAIAETARALAWFDVASAFGRIARERDYVRPRVDDGLAFSIRAGRHPVVERALARSGEDAFVPNDCDLTPSSEDGERPGRLWLVTGPNMAGKSTFLRQNALIAVMAQIGCFVPAADAHVGVVDRLFSRVGAADDLARGRSTVMVEMVEPAGILNQAGPRALVILDEIGRGTATFDGLSIAWATIEHLHEVNACRGLFATHYHELTQLSGTLGELSNHAMRVREWQGEVVFLHEVGPGTADRSYGIHVARLAGLPAAAIARAEEVLDALESGEKAEAVSKLADDLPLFAAAPARAAAPVAPQNPSPLEAALEGVNPDELSPREALELLYRLKTLSAENPGEP